MSAISGSVGHEAVVLSLRRMPQIIEISEEEAISPVLRLAGQNFRDSGSGEGLGFYDRLINRKGEMIGIQQWIDEFSHLQFFKNFMGVEIDLVQQVVRIFFGDSRDVDEASSASQDFGRRWPQAAVGRQTAATVSFRCRRVSAQHPLTLLKSRHRGMAGFRRMSSIRRFD
jgi:hypothetical protein